MRLIKYMNDYGTLFFNNIVILREKDNIWKKFSFL